MSKITILTHQVSYTDAFAGKIRNVLRFLRAFGKGGIVDLDYLRYGGHVAVTRSLLRGLQTCDVPYNYNPVSIADIGDVVVVLSGVDALRQAIHLKKQGRIKKLLAGPNIVEMPTEHDNLLASPEIDTCLVPSDMTATIYERLTPALIGRVVPWYVGIDETYWDLPTQRRSLTDKNVLVYWKNAPKIFCLEVERLLIRYGYQPIRIVYGGYTKDVLRDALQDSIFAVFLSITETQGIALAESWAMDVPTLVWDPEIEHYYLRGVQTTAAPYLSDKTGARWKELGELEALLRQLDTAVHAFSPRSWVMEHMTDRIAAQKLVQLCEITTE